MKPFEGGGPERHLPDLEGTFDQDIAAKFCRCIEYDKPIALKKEWTHNDVMILAAVCIGLAREVFFAEGDAHLEHIEAKVVDRAEQVDALVDCWADLFMRMGKAQPATICESGIPLPDRLQCVVARDPETRKLTVQLPELGETFS